MLDDANRVRPSDIIVPTVSKEGLNKAPHIICEHEEWITVKSKRDKRKKDRTRKP